MLRSKIPNGFEGFPRSWQYLVPPLPKHVALSRDEGAMVMELKDQAATQNFSCLEAVMPEMHHWMMRLVTGKEYELQLSDLSLGTFYIFDLYL